MMTSSMGLLFFWYGIDVEIMSDVFQQIRIGGISFNFFIDLIFPPKNLFWRKWRKYKNNKKNRKDIKNIFLIFYKKFLHYLLKEN
jgi:hypothetical protein